MPRNIVTTAEDYFRDHPLFELLELRNGSMSNSFQSRNNDYDLKCKHCGTTFNRQGDSSAFKVLASCPACRYKYNNIEKKILAPNGATAATLEELPEEEVPGEAPAKTKVKKMKVLAEPKAKAPVEPKDEETVTELAKGFDPFAILAQAQARTTGENVATAPKVVVEYGDEDIDEPPRKVPKAKAKAKAPKAEVPAEVPVTVPTPVVVQVPTQPPCSPQITTESVQMVRLKAGQTIVLQTVNGPVFIIAEP